jgi:hypothetical protein
MSYINFESKSSGVSQILVLDKDPKKIEQPTVYFTNEALATIDYIVAQCAKEIAWLGLVEEMENSFLVTKVYLPKQTVTGTSVDIEPDAMNLLIHELITAGEDPNKLRYHGHSHVNMAVNPSSIDQNHMRDYLEHVDYFIRSIHNKKGDTRVDVYDKRTMLVHHNVPHDNWDLLQDDAFYDRLDQVLEDQITVKLIKHAAKPWTQKPANTHQPSANALLPHQQQRQAAQDLYYASIEDDEDEDDELYESRTLTSAEVHRLIRDTFDDGDMLPGNR